MLVFKIYLMTFFEGKKNIFPIKWGKLVKNILNKSCQVSYVLYTVKYKA
jgi:hypothetical protein